MQKLYSDGEVGSRIRARRIAVGLSQQQVANKLGVSYQQVQKYEMGANRISPGRLLLLSQTLRMPIASFFDDVFDAGPAKDVIDLAQAIQLLDTVQLNSAFNRIHNLVLRHRIVALVEAISRADKNAGSIEHY